MKELQFLCERLDFIHIYCLQKLMFIYKLTGINNKCASVFTDVLVNLSLCALSLILIYVIVVLSKVMFLVILCSCRQSSSVVF